MVVLKESHVTALSLLLKRNGYILWLVELPALSGDLKSEARKRKILSPGWENYKVLFCINIFELPSNVLLTEDQLSLLSCLVHCYYILADI